MSQEMPASPVETMRFLTDYHKQTYQLYQLLRVAAVDDINVDLLTEYLAARDQLIVAFGQRPLTPSGAESESLLTEVRQMDAVISNRLQVLLESTQVKMQGFQEQKRGMNAYQSEYAANSVYFDRRK